MTNMAQTMAKNDKIIVPLQHWGLCLPDGNMISVHLWNRRSAIILKYFVQNLKNSLVAKRTGPSMLRPWVGHTNRVAWQWAETLLDIRETLADIRGTIK